MDKPGSWFLLAKHFYISGTLVGNGLIITLSLSVTRCEGHNTNLPSNRNISKMIRLDMAFTAMYFEENSISFLVTSRLIDFALVVP